MTAEPTRQVSGTPVGGQFAPTTRPETGPTLSGDAYWADLKKDGQAVDEEAYWAAPQSDRCLSPCGAFEPRRHHLLDECYATPPETSDTMSPDPTRFGPQGPHVDHLLERIAALTPQEMSALSAHAPMVTYDGLSSEMFCPNADATRYTGLGRYRGMTRTGGPLEAEVQLALDEVGAAASHLPEPVVEALKDAAVAQVTYGQVHAIAYDTLTRAVRHALGPIRDGDGPLHR